MKLLLIPILGFFVSIVNASSIPETSAARDALIRVYNYAGSIPKDTSNNEKTSEKKDPNKELQEQLGKEIHNRQQQLLKDQELEKEKERIERENKDKVRLEKEEKERQDEIKKKETERLEKERQDEIKKKELENEKLENERLENEKIEKEKVEKEDKERLEKERLEKEEKERKEKEEKERLDKEKIDKEKENKEKEKERKEKERLEKEKVEKEEKERLEKEEKERLEKERLEKERLEKEKEEKEKIEKEKQQEKERLDKKEKERLEKEKERQDEIDKKELEKEKLEKERLDKEKEKEEKERLEKEKEKTGNLRPEKEILEKPEIKKRELLDQIEKSTKGKCEINKEELEYYGLDDLEVLAKKDKDMLCFLARYPELFYDILTEIKDMNDENATFVIFSTLIKEFLIPSPKTSTEKANNIIISGLGIIPRELFISNTLFRWIVAGEKDLDKDPKDHPTFDVEIYKRQADGRILKKLEDENSTIITGLRKAFKGYEDKVEATVDEIKRNKKDSKSVNPRFLELLKSKIQNKLEEDEEKEEKTRLEKKKQELIDQVETITKDKCKINKENLNKYYDHVDLEMLVKKKEKLLCFLARYPKFFTEIPAKIKDMNDEKIAHVILSKRIKTFLIPSPEGTIAEAKNIIINGIDILFKEMLIPPEGFLFNSVVRDNDLQKDPSDDQPPSNIESYKAFIDRQIVNQLKDKNNEKYSNIIDKLNEAFKGYDNEVETTIKSIDNKFLEPFEIKIRVRLENEKGRNEQIKKQRQEKQKLITKIKEIIGKCKINEEKLYEYSTDDLKVLADKDKGKWPCFLARYPELFTGIPTKIEYLKDENAIPVIFSTILESFLMSSPKLSAEKAENIIINGLGIIFKSLPSQGFLFEKLMEQDERVKEKEPNSKPQFDLSAHKANTDYLILTEIKNKSPKIFDELKNAFKGYDNEVEAAVEKGDFKSTDSGFLSFLKRNIQERLEKESKNNSK